MTKNPPVKRGVFFCCDIIIDKEINKVKDRALESKLEMIISGMDLPWNRKSELNPTKLRWLQKNIGYKNKDNPKYTEALDVIQKLINNG